MRVLPGLVAGILASLAVAKTYPGNIESLVSHKCLDIPGNDVTNGNLLWVWSCTDGPGTTWEISPDQEIRPKAHKDKCLDMPYNDQTEGNQLGIWDCGGWAQQQWGYDPEMKTIYLASSSDATRCMDLAGGDKHDGTAVIIWGCNGLKNQQWHFHTKTPAPSPPAPAPPAPTPGGKGTGTISNPLTKLCLDLPGGDPTNGNKLWLWTCNGENSQNWRLEGDSLLSGVKTSSCVDGLSMQRGQQLEIWDCNGQPQQKFGYDTNQLALYLTNSDQDASMCLQMRDGSGLPSTPLEVWPCLPYETQKWTLAVPPAGAVVTV